MLCTNGHNNTDDAKFCATCGVNTFQPGSSTGIMSQQPDTSYNGLAIASMVLGIVWIYGLGSLLALIFGLVAKRQIKERGQRGSGMATAGIVLGIIGIVGAIILIVGLATAVNHCHYDSNGYYVC
jgi:hypothetical protein